MSHNTNNNTNDNNNNINNIGESKNVDDVIITTIQLSSESKEESLNNNSAGNNISGSNNKSQKSSLNVNARVWPAANISNNEPDHDYISNANISSGSNAIRGSNSLVIMPNINAVNNVNIQQIRQLRSLGQTNLISHDTLSLSNSNYNSLIDLYLDSESGLDACFEFSIQHGLLPILNIRYIRDIMNEDIVKASIEWLLMDLDASFRLIGVDAECGLHSVRVRLIQISTRNRCILLRIPLHIYPNRVPLPIITLLEDRTIFKSGADIWGDALDIYRDLGIRMNACLNMSLVNQKGKYSLSLEAMTNNIIGREGFIKDKETTISDWDSVKLSFRQLMYGALDAQTSYIIGTANNKPYPFHIYDISRQWLDYASQWILMQKYTQRELEQSKIDLAVELIEFHTQNIAHVKLKNYSVKIRFENCCYINYIDGSSELALIDRIDGKLLWLNIQLDNSNTTNKNRRSEDFVRLTMNRDKELELIQLPIRQYLSRMIQGQEKFNPFVSTILDMPFARNTNNTNTNNNNAINRKSLNNTANSNIDNSRRSFNSNQSINELTVNLQSTVISPNSNTANTTSITNNSSNSSPVLTSYNSNTAFDDTSVLSDGPLNWWYNDDFTDPNIDYNTLPKIFNNLNDSQRHALILSDHYRIVGVHGVVGSGKTFTIAMEVLRSLRRQSSNNNSNSDNGCRVLVLTETNVAARHLCSILSKYLTSDDVSLFVSEDFILEWPEPEYPEIFDGGFLPTDSDIANQYQSMNRSVLITTVNYALNMFYTLGLNNLLQYRESLLIDESHQIWILKAVLLFRLLHSTERLLMFGDQNQFQPFISREVLNPVSLLAATTSLNRSMDNISTRPRCWTIKQSMLSQQYRMNKHISDLCSYLFYDNKMSSIDESSIKGIYWKDVKQSPSASVKCEYTKSIYNAKEADEILKLWLSLEREGFESKDIIILCIYQAQKQYIEQNLNLPVYTVEQYTGRECEIVILSLSSDYVNSYLSDRYRVNVACSRAKQRLYIVGNKFAMQRIEGNWKKIAEYEQNTDEQTTHTRKQSIPDMIQDFPSLGQSTNKDKEKANNNNNSDNSSPLNKSKPVSPNQPPNTTTTTTPNTAWSKLFPGSNNNTNNNNNTGNNSSNNNVSSSVQLQSAATPFAPQANVNTSRSLLHNNSANNNSNANPWHTPTKSFWDQTVTTSSTHNNNNIMLSPQAQLSPQPNPSYASTNNPYVQSSPYSYNNNSYHQYPQQVPMQMPIQSQYHAAVAQHQMQMAAAVAMNTPYLQQFAAAAAYHQMVAAAAAQQHHHQQQQQQQQAYYLANAALVASNNEITSPTKSNYNKPPACHFYAKGYCANGNNCAFSHDIPNNNNNDRINASPLPTTSSSSSAAPIYPPGLAINNQFNNSNFNNFSTSYNNVNNQSQPQTPQSQSTNSASPNNNNANLTAANNLTATTTPVKVGSGKTVTPIANTAWPPLTTNTPQPTKPTAAQIVKTAAVANTFNTTTPVKSASTTVPANTNTNTLPHNSSANSATANATPIRSVNLAAIRPTPTTTSVPATQSSVVAPSQHKKTKSRDLPVVASSAIPSKWICTVCTLENSGNNIKCEACGSDYEPQFITVGKK